MKQQPNQGNTETTQMNELKLKAKGIFFDLDGTILDSRAAYLDAAKTAFQATGKNPPEAETALEIPRRLEQHLPINDIVNGDVRTFLEIYLKTYYDTTWAKSKPVPNVAETLKTLAEKAKLALVTMRFVPRENIMKELEHFNIAEYFTYVVTALDTPKPKPSPEALIKCVQALDVQICECIMVGDSISDVKAGKTAGAKTVAVLTGLFSHAELAKENPDLILNDVTQLPPHIE